MSALLDMPADELLEHVEMAAAGGDRRAALVLRKLVEQLEEDGRLSVINRLAAARYVPGQDCN